MKTETKSIQTFYDAFSGRLVSDYVHGNARLAAAQEHVLQSIPTSATRILELGCGIGVVADAISRAFPNARIDAVDLSIENVANATKLFASDRIQFSVRDITASEPLGLEHYDAVVMVDVLEHVPAADRERLFDAIKARLKADASFIATFPSPSFQNYLRTSRPDEIQPVDEDISPEIFGQIAQSLGGEVRQFSFRTIWRTEDYVHAVIVRGATREAGSAVRVGGASRADRAERVRARLGIRVAPTGIVLQERSGPAIAVVAPNVPVTSEVFLRQHMSGLPFHTHVLFADPSWMDETGRPLAGFRSLSKGLRIVQWRGHRAETPLLAYWLRSHRIQSVLAEFGPTAVSMLDACKLTGTPLVAHFHGFDAYQFSVLREFESEYRRLFSEAVALIAVSPAMREQLVSLGADPAKIQVIPCGAFVSDEAVVRAGKNPRTAVSVGRFVEKKGPWLTIAAFAEARKSVPDAKLVMLGDGPLLPICRDLVRTLGVQDSVTFLGAANHATVMRELRAARVFVQHSVVASNGDCEGSPVAVVEAQLSGLPVVATRHTGIVEAVEDGVTGYLVEERDVAGMAQRLSQLLSKPELASKMGLAARKRAVSRYDANVTISALAEVIAKSIRR